MTKTAKFLFCVFMFGRGVRFFYFIFLPLALGFAVIGCVTCLCHFLLDIAIGSGSVYENLFERPDIIIMSDFLYHRAGNSNIVVDIWNIPTLHLYSIYRPPQIQENIHPSLFQNFACCILFYDSAQIYERFHPFVA